MKYDAHRAHELMEMLERSPSDAGDRADDEEVVVLPRRFVIDACEDMLLAIGFFEPLYAECDEVIDLARESFVFRLMNWRRSKRGASIFPPMRAGYRSIIDSVLADPDKPFVEIKRKYVRVADEWSHWYLAERERMVGGPYR